MLPQQSLSFHPERNAGKNRGDPRAASAGFGVAAWPQATGTGVPELTHSEWLSAITDFL